MEIFQVISVDADGFTSAWTPVRKVEAALAQINEFLSDWNQQIEQSGDPDELEFRVPLADRLLNVVDGHYEGDEGDIVEFRYYLEMHFDGTGYVFGPGEVFIVKKYELAD